MNLLLATILIFSWVDPPKQQDTSVTTKPVRYRGVLKSPGGELPFFFELESSKNKCRAWLVEGKNRTELSCSVDPDLRLVFEPYGSVIEAKKDGFGWKGVWRKPTGKDIWSQLEFEATTSEAEELFERSWSSNRQLAGSEVVGRWSMRFKKDEGRVVAVFSQRNGRIHGTILSPTGDYGYLTGVFQGTQLRLVGFDGAHAFLFDAHMKSDDTLEGDFWSRDSYHDTWTAKRDDSAAIPDTFKLVKPTGKADWSSLKFRDLDGKLRSLDESAFRGKARIIEVSGSWCPNCNDSARFLAELHRKYRDRGLSVIGLSFEVSGDVERDAVRVRKFIARHHVEYPFLIGGLANKEAASKALPFLEGVRAFPTTIFLSEDGRVKAVDTGFSGPATGEEYERLKKRYEALVEELLAESKR